MNKFKKEDHNDPEKEEKSRGRGVQRTLVRFLNGAFLTRDEVLSHIPYFFFLAFLLTCYIAYGYYTERTVKELYRVRKEMKELRSEYITTKTRLMFKSKRSEVVEATEKLGLRESTQPPEKIVVEER